MRLTGSSLLAIAERRTPVVVPGHFEYTRVGCDPFDPKSWAEWAIKRRQIRHEAQHFYPLGGVTGTEFAAAIAGNRSA